MVFVGGVLWGFLAGWFLRAVVDYYYYGAGKVDR